MSKVRAYDKVEDYFEKVEGFDGVYRRHLDDKVGFAGIYCITNLVTDTKYVGAGKNVPRDVFRLSNAIIKEERKPVEGFNNQLIDEVRKLGVRNFKFEMLHFIDKSIYNGRYSKVNKTSWASKLSAQLVTGEKLTIKSKRPKKKKLTNSIIENQISIKEIKNMDKYKVGDKFYRNNKKTRELEEIRIVDIQYVFDRKVGSRANYTYNEIQELFSKGALTDDANVLKLEAIAKIEKQFGIKLKEV